MPSIADQVATIEHDLSDALAQIDTLRSINDALTSANKSLISDNAALQASVNDMKHYVDDTRAMVEKLSQSALDMLRASRRQVGGQAEAIPFAPKPIVVPALHPDNAAVIASINAAQNVAQNNEPEPPAQQAVAEIMAGDSGDEHQPWHPAEDDDQDHHLTVAEIATLEQDAGNANAISSDTTPLPPNKFEPMPIFLQRDTEFAPSARIVRFQQIFG